MQITVDRPVQIAVDAIRLRLPIRYPEDFDEEVGADFPEQFIGPNRSSLTVVLDLDSRKVRDWPAGKTANVYIKVCDEGTYELLAGERVVARRADDYVPSCVPGEFGDYFVMKIATDGSIDGWRPDVQSVAAEFGSRVLPAPADDETGFDRAPSKYMAHGREAVDILRDELGDQAFRWVCVGTARLYELRAGHKPGVSAETDLTKARWWRQMAAHVDGLGPDPRAGRRS